MNHQQICVGTVLFGHCSTRTALLLPTLVGLRKCSLAVCGFDALHTVARSSTLPCAFAGCGTALAAMHTTQQP